VKENYTFFYGNKDVAGRRVQAVTHLSTCRDMVRQLFLTLSCVPHPFFL
jgi:hypothetical protein